MDWEARSFGPKSKPRGRGGSNFHNGQGRFGNHGSQMGQQAQYSTHSAQAEKVGVVIGLGYANPMGPKNQILPAGQVNVISIPGLTDEKYRELQNFINKLNEPTEHFSGTRLFSDNITWILDTGASRHMTENWQILQKRRMMIRPISITLPDGEVLWAISEGQVRLCSNFILKNVLFILGFTYNLISIGRLTDELQCSVTMYPNSCVIQDLTLKMLTGAGEIWGGVYSLQCVTSPPATISLMAKDSNRELWHRRLGHSSVLVMKLLCPTIEMDKIDYFCNTCLRAKEFKKPFPVSDSRASEIFDLIHCDLWGPYNTTSLSGARYLLTIVDDYSREVWVYLL